MSKQASGGGRAHQARSRGAASGMHLGSHRNIARKEAEAADHKGNGGKSSAAAKIQSERISLKFCMSNIAEGKILALCTF